MCLSRPTNIVTQSILTDWITGDYKYKNIEPQGDPFVWRKEDDGITRFGYRNIGGTTLGQGFEVVDELEAIAELGIDVQGYSEINKPWSSSNKWQYDAMMNILFNRSQSVYSAMKADYDTNYQPGGNLLTINGDTTGRIKDSGSDPLGRFCWFTLRGKRDEGIIVITAYRVCHEKSDNPGPYTAFSQQYTALRESGVKEPNPRKQILNDLTQLIDQKRKEGYRPIVMMDANGDYNYEKSRDSDLAKFVQDNNLADEYHNRFPDQINTYIYGSKRLDYIFVDPALVDSIVRIGYLGSHEGTFSDHVQAYVDFDTERLFKGRINRPMDLHSREFRLEHYDRVCDFQTKVREKLDNNNVKQLVLKLAINFKRHGRTKKNVRRYQILDNMIMDAARSAANAVARKKYGYMRNPRLFLAGRALILNKMILDCKRRSAPYTPALLRRAKNMEVDLSQYDSLTVKDMMKEVRLRRAELWEAQKLCEEGRVEWLREEAKKRAEAGDKDTERVFQDMRRIAETRAINRKLTCILKPRSGAIDRIQIPTHDWFFSAQSNELYHYDKGNFETHPHKSEDLYHTHHTLKVPNNDIVQCQVEDCGDGIRLVEKYRWFYSSSKDAIYFREGKETQTYKRASCGSYCLRRDSPLPADAMVCTVEQLPHNRCRLVETLPIQAQIWQDVTNPEEMEWILLERNKRHLQQLDAEGSCQDPVMVDLLKDHGLSPAAKDLLAGRFTTTHSVSQEMREWMNQIAQTPSEKDSPPIIGCLTKDEYQEAFKAADEKTSSSPAGLHYTIWKAMAAVDYLAEFLCIMISLPFLYGFVNNRWRNEVDVMLEKKKGVRKIHQLRIIGLLEADFNTALKFFFSRKMQSASEDNGSLSDEQHGSRANRKCLDAIMTKLLTFECARSKRTSLAETQHDKRACFDRMHTSMSNLHASKQNVSDELLEARSATIDGLRRSVKTSLGVSSKTYHQVDGEHRIHGEVQGKGDVPSLFCQQSSVLLKAHESLAPGVELNSCTGQRSIRHNNVCYVDDNDGQVTASHTSDHPVQEVVEKLQTSVDVWNKLVQLSGHSLAFHKECWTLLAFEWLEGKMQLVRAVEDTIVLEDGKGVFSVITFKSPDEPNGGLGVKCCPDGNQRHHLKAIRSKVASICGAVSSAFLTEKEAFQALIQRLIPTLSYQLHVTSLSESACGGINTLIRRAFLPPLKVNRHMPNAVIYAPLEYGGMEFPEVYTLQDQLQIPFFIQCLRMNGKLANDFLTTLDNIQLDSGFVSPIMEDISLPIDFIDEGWIICLRERMREMNAGIWIEDAWTPKLQRENDSSIMEVVSQLFGITPLQLFKINEVRKYLRVITIADLASICGTQINANMMNGEWTAGTDLEWPRQEAPPKAWFALFRKCIREAYSTRSPSGLRPNSPMILDTPLGSWFPVERNTWWTTYRSREAIFYRNDDGEVEEFRPSGHGFFSFHGKVDRPPIDSHPITVQRVDDRFWTHRTTTLVPTEDPPKLLPGHILNDTFDRYNQSPVKCGSDGSLHLRHQVAAAAWLITHGGSEHVSACFLLTDVASVSIYRAELEGVFRTLKHIEYLDMSPCEVVQWCDNELSVWQSITAPTRARQMIEPEADLILAIHALRSKLRHDIDIRHVYGHQDEKGKEKADKAKAEYEKVLAEWEQLSDDDSDASTAEAQVKYLFTPKPPRPIPPFREPDPTASAIDVQINTECDRIASQTTAAMLGDGEIPPQPILSMPYEGSKAMFKIGGRWVTKNYKREIYRARRTKHIRAYCKEKYGWTEETFQLVHWESIGTIRSQLTVSGKRQTMKLMHGWLPVMHMRQFISGLNHCPGCRCTDETLDHVFQCPNNRMKQLRSQLLEKLLKAARAKRIPRNIMEAVCHALRSFGDNEQVMSRDTYSPVCHALRSFGDNEQVMSRDTYSPQLQEAYRQQRLIGFNLLSRGYLAKGWLQALEAAGLSNPDRQMNSLQRLLWDEWAFPIWTERNSILHGPDSKYLAAEDSSLSERILWFLANKEQVLARGDQFMANIDVTRLHRMRRETKKAWIKHLDKLREAFRIENVTRAAGQRPITEFLIRVHDGIS